MTDTGHHDQPDQFIPVSKAAAMLPFKVTSRTLRRWGANGFPDVRRIGRRWYARSRWVNDLQDAAANGSPAPARPSTVKAA